MHEPNNADVQPYMQSFIPLSLAPKLFEVPVTHKITQMKGRKDRNDRWTNANVHASHPNTDREYKTLFQEDFGCKKTTYIIAVCLFYLFFFGGGPSIGSL